MGTAHREARVILTLSDGREIRLPESWGDGEAREFGADVIAGRVSAEQLDELRRRADWESAHPQLAMLAELRAIRRLLAADRVLIQNRDGEPIASRVHIRRETL
jgi:hypothetical protein